MSYNNEDEQNIYNKGVQDGKELAYKSIVSQIKDAVDTYEAYIFICDAGKIAYCVDPGLETHIEVE